MARNKRTSNGCCSVDFLKYVLYIYNVLFFLAGCLVLGTAIWTLIDRYQYVALLTTIIYPILVYFLLAAGGLVVVVTIIGFCAVAKENKRLLLLYIFSLLLIFLMEAMVGILAFVYREQVRNELELHLNTTFKETYSFDSDKTYAIDYLQDKFNCCGVESFRDWESSRWRLETVDNPNLVPDSCCISILPHCGRRTHPSNIYRSGCLSNMEEHMKTHLGILSAVGLGICILQIFGIAYACSLYCRLKDDEIKYNN